MKISGKEFKKALLMADLTQEKAAERIGVARQTVNTWVKSAELSLAVLDKIKSTLQIDLTYKSEEELSQKSNIAYKEIVNPNERNSKQMEFSDISVLNSQERWPENSKFPYENTTPTTNTDKKGVPYYDIDFMGGFDLVFNSQQVQPSFYIDFLPFNDCDCWINVTGKSMGPLIAHGDIVGLKQVADWQRFLLEGEIYAIITDNGFRTIKMLGAGPDRDSYTLIPYNKSEEYKPQVIPKDVITHIFRVKGNIKKFF